MIKNIINYLQKNNYLLFLLVFVILCRLPILGDQMIPFQFDHGKDAIATFHMWQTVSPKFIGPWTSIPGLFFGPAWYYILLPGMVISGGAPIASVVTMLVIGLLTVGVLYKYFGKVEATLFATSALFFTVTTSAWNPFPMVFLTVLILTVLKEIEKTNKLTTKKAVLLGVFAALGFHFSTAFAIFYPLLIVVSLLIKKTATNIKQILAGLLAFFVPFIPQIIFEIRHNFIQVKSVVAYLQKGDSDPVSIQKFTAIVVALLGEIKGVLFPASYFSEDAINKGVFFIFIVIFLITLYIFIKQKRKRAYLWIDACLWFTLPTLAFTFLHFNIWYLLPLVTFAFILLGQVLTSAPKQLAYIFLGLCFAASLSRVTFYVTTDKEQLLKAPGFLPNKQKAIEYVYSQAQGRPFASYHFMGDVYDYPYQYLYFMEALHNKKLPTEFSYKPDEVTYIPEKTDLLQTFSAQQDTRSPEVIFYVVEKPDSEETKASNDRWWNEQQYGEIIEEYSVSEKLTVYTATPKNTNQQM